MANQANNLPPMKKISPYIWEIPKTYKEGMLVPARIIASEELLKGMDSGVVEQVSNVACLPGIQKYALALSDAHWGYGMPIGGVAAFDLDEGVISPGAVGFDINCGVRMAVSNLNIKEVKPKMKELVDTLYKTVPAGVGSKGFVKINSKQFDDIMINGAQWSIDNGFGLEEDRKRMEEHGKIEGADPSKVSQRARQRGIGQLGTLGSGNHYLAIQSVNQIFDEKTANVLGVNEEGQVAVMIHCGSRGFGHQIATDYLKLFDDAMRKYNIKLKDRQLACAHFNSKEGQDYFGAMACAANMAFANRQVILHRVREGFAKVFGEKAKVGLVYDATRNIAKIEEYEVDGEKKKVLVHRKGATRSFGPGNKELDEKYQKIGQPVIIGGSMETGSYLLVGTKKAEEETFGSTAHGSGRTMSRTAAKHQVRGEKLLRDMDKKGIYVRANSMSGLAEEAGFAYKNISEVIDAIDGAGISKKIVQLKPVGNIKG